jgi:hypothetical protein
VTHVSELLPAELRVPSLAMAKPVAVPLGYCPVAVFTSPNGAVKTAARKEFPASHHAQHDQSVRRQAHLDPSVLAGQCGTDSPGPIHHRTLSR